MQGRRRVRILTVSRNPNLRQGCTLRWHGLRQSRSCDHQSSTLHRGRVSEAIERIRFAGKHGKFLTSIGQCLLKVIYALRLSTDKKFRPGKLVALTRPELLYEWSMYKALAHQADDQVHVDGNGLIIELAGLEMRLLDRFHDPRIPVGAD